MIDDRFARVASIRGDEVGQPRRGREPPRAISAIEQIVASEGIDCDFRRVDGYLFPGADGPDTVNARRWSCAGSASLRASWAAVAGARTARPAVPRPGPVPPPEVPRRRRKCDPQAWRRDPHRHPGDRIEGGEPCNVHTEAGHTVTAEAVVVATNSPFDAGMTMHTRSWPRT